MCEVMQVSRSGFYP
jgi:putative transposase